MPELPDLQVFSRNLEKLIKGKKLEKIQHFNKRTSGTTQAALKRLSRQTVRRVYREGKEIFFEFSGGDLLTLHLMMHGAIHWVQDDAVPKHALYELVFRNFSIVITDWQRAARLQFNPPSATSPDALSSDVNLSFLKKALQRRTSIKNLLLDQKIIRGIGNAYADEILWDAGISPFSKSDKIPDKFVKALMRSIKRVLKNGEKSIRKADPERLSGELRDFLVIHNSKKKSSPSGKPIKHQIIGGRKTYYTAEQQLFK